MGKLCVAAKITHVPTMLMSEEPGRLHGCRKPAIDGHKQIAQMAKDLDVDTVVVLDTHWLVNAGYHINARDKFSGTYTSNEFPISFKTSATNTTETQNLATKSLSWRPKKACIPCRIRWILWI